MAIKHLVSDHSGYERYQMNVCPYELYYRFYLNIVLLT